MRGPQEQRTDKARRLRKADNVAEQFLWLGLRNRQLSGYKFVRQFPLGPYFADFACRDARLVVEIDGSQHIDSAHDAARDLFMNAQGWSVARFWHADVLQDKTVVLDTILAICEGGVSQAVESREFKFRPASARPLIRPVGPPSPRLRREGETFMRRAIELARAQLGRTWPNPPVGCVLVRDGVIIAEAATGDGGRPHAEEAALAMAAEAARAACAYVTLEPCGERSTGAASCSQRLIEAGVARVVYACADPSPYASHKGVQRMKDAGLHPESGLLADEAAFLIAGFVHWLRTGLPQVVARTDQVDAVLELEPEADLEAELRARAAMGYRLMGVAPDSGLARRLDAAGLLSK